MPHLSMNRLGSCLGIDEDNVDALIAQGDLQLGCQTTRHGGAIGDSLIGFNEQINVTAASRLVEA